jgi:hypothetical protein
LQAEFLLTMEEKRKNNEMMLKGANLMPREIERAID